MHEKAVNKRIAKGKAKNLRKMNFRANFVKSKIGYTVYYYKRKK
jgi:hypothetical protein